MPMPKSVTKIDKNGVTFVSNVDAVKYTIQELIRAALRDCAKLLRKRIIAKMKTLPGMKRSRRPYKATQYWVRKQECDLQIGFGNSKQGTSGDTWYAIRQELGSKGQPKRDFLRSTVMESIDDIIKIQSQYLSAINNGSAESLIDEQEHISPEGDE